MIKIFDVKRAQQAAQKKETKKNFILFSSVKQCIGFLFFIVVIILSSWIIITVKNWIDDPRRMLSPQLILTGSCHFTTEADIHKAIMGLRGANTYIAQDVDGIQQEVMRLPWIRQVSVRKQWPDRLIIHVVEYQPRYYWNGIFLLDKDGTLFSVPKERIKDETMPKLFGPIGKEKLILDIYRELEAASNSSSNKGLTLSIRLALADERNAWQVVVTPCVGGFCVENQDIRLMLGREEIVGRYQRFIRFFPDIQSRLLTNERLIEADLRYENGIAVKKQKIES